jgi:hypothetical protein
MGKVKKILLEDKLPDRELHNSRMFVDLSENVHIHFRELRLMFGVEEFLEFSEILKKGARDIKKYLIRHRDYKEQKVFDGIMVGEGRQRQLMPLKNSPKPHESKYFPNRLQVELQEEEVIDAVHLHYRDYRLVMNIETFKSFARGMARSLASLEKHLAQHPYQEGKHPFRKVVSEEHWQDQKISWSQRLKYRIKRILGKTEAG